MTKNNFKHSTNPFVRDVFLAYLITGARRTVPDGYPIIEKWMVATEPPKDVVQWDCRYEVRDPKATGISFYCKDEKFTPILNNPHHYVEKLRQYSCVIGMDASPYDNMPLVVQKSQIYTNLAITYCYGTNELRVIPNVRLGNDETIGMLDAIPKECLIAIGTHGFTWRRNNRDTFRNQLDVAIDTLRPSGLVVYGQTYDDVFSRIYEQGIPVYQYDSHTMKRNAKVKAEKLSAGDCYEG